MKYFFGILFFVAPLFAQTYNIPDGKITIDEKNLELKCNKANDEFVIYSGIKAHKHKIYKLNENGEFEWEIYFNRKPLSNILIFRVKNWQKYDFYYQPPLTKKDIIEGAFRQEGIDGSYAVYWKDKKNNQYKTGKICHIKRPVAIDDKGEKIWCNLYYDKGKLKVEIPKNWFDTHNIKMLDPTFGYTSIGATEQGYTANTLTASSVTVTGTGTMSKITIYIHSTGGAAENVKSMMWTDSSAYPGSYMAGNKTVLAISPAAAQWYDFTSTTVISSTGNYWIGWIGDSSGTMTYYWDEAGYVIRYSKADNYATPTDPFPASATSSTRKVSIYGTYSTGGTSTFVPSNILLLE